MKKIITVAAIIAMLTATACAEEIFYKVITDDGIKTVNIYGLEQTAFDNQILAVYEITEDELIPVKYGFDGENFATYDSVAEIEYIS